MINSPGGDPFSNTRRKIVLELNKMTFCFALVSVDEFYLRKIYNLGYTLQCGVYVQSWVEDRLLVI